MSPAMDTTESGQLQLVDGAGVRHSLGDRLLAAGDRLELLTEAGWVTGHYLAQHDPETGCPLFEMHLVTVGGGDQHVRMHLPHGAMVR